MKCCCIECDAAYDAATARTRCDCGGLLEARGDWKPAPDAWRARPLGVWRYREMLPLPAGADVVTLSEGGTGLHAAPRLAQWVGVDELWVKNEGENPTGSFKDRGMTVGVSFAKAHGYKALGCASTGNTSASLAAYAARAGLTALVLVPAGKIAMGKMAQAIVHGARVLAVRGNFDDALEVVNSLAEAGEVYLLNSVNPLRLEGQKTLAWEVLDQLAGRGGPPDRLVFPVGNAGNISAAHKALREWVDAGLLAADAVPRLTGVQAAGAAPFARLIQAGGDALEPEAAPETEATAIRIGHPVNWPKALRAVRDTGGAATTASDGDILEAQRALARLEGVFVEPASAASVAGLKRLVAEGAVDRDERVVCVTTGNGLKDPDAVLRHAADAITEVDATVEAVRGALQ